MQEDNQPDTAVDTPAASDGPASAAAPETAQLQRERDEYYDLLLRKTAEHVFFR